MLLIQNLKESKYYSVKIQLRRETLTIFSIISATSVLTVTFTDESEKTI